MYIWGLEVACDEAKKKRFLGVGWGEWEEGRRNCRLQAGLAPEGFRIDNYLHCRAWGGLQVSACLKISPLLAVHWSVTQPAFLFPIPSVRGFLQRRGVVAYRPLFKACNVDTGRGEAVEGAWPNFLAGRHSIVAFPRWGQPSAGVIPALLTLPPSSHPWWEGPLQLRAITENKWNHSFICIWYCCDCLPPTPFLLFQGPKHLIRQAFGFESFALLIPLIPLLLHVLLWFHKGLRFEPLGTSDWVWLLQHGDEDLCGIFPSGCQSPINVATGFRVLITSWHLDSKLILNNWNFCLLPTCWCQNLSICKVLH